jgi:chromosome partitioning protein
MKNCKILVLSNQKGGTGKTTSAYNLGVALSKMDKRVLLVDFDPQANLTSVFGIEAPDELPVSMHDLLNCVMDGDKLPPRNNFIIGRSRQDEDGQMNKSPLSTNSALHIIPSNINLALDEQNLQTAMDRERALSEILAPLREDYDYIIIDTNPTIGLLTINALVACDEVIIPASPQLWSVTGLSALIGSIMKIKRKLNPRIEIAGILLTMCDSRTKLYREAKSLIEEFCGDKINVFMNYIPATTKAGEANYESRSLLDYAPENPAARAYEAFAAEVDSRSREEVKNG